METETIITKFISDELLHEKMRKSRLSRIVSHQRPELFKPFSSPLKLLLFIEERFQFEGEGWGSASH